MQKKQKKSVQLSLFQPGPLAHGGSLGIGRRKTKRPLCTKRSIHVVMRAEAAQNNLSLRVPANRRFIENLKERLSKSWQITIYEFAVAGNHIHILLRAKSRDGFANFLREFCGKVALFVTKARKGCPFGKRFWTLLTYSRIVEWGKAFFAAKAYIVKNALEAMGLIPYSPRKAKPIRAPTLTIARC